MSKSKNIVKPLTAKQETFCQEYIKTGNQSEAYRRAYNATNMKPETINNKAYVLMNKDDIRARVELLQKEVAERNKIDIDECVAILAKIARFDIADVFNENGELKPIHQISRDARTAISSIESIQLFEYKDGEKVPDGILKKIKTISKEGAIDKLLKHLGGYEKDNRQKQTVIDFSKLDPKTLIDIWNARNTVD